MINLEKIIEIDILDESDFLERYNKQIVSSELLHYIINQATYLNNKDSLKMIIHRKCHMPDNYLKILKDALEREYIFYKRRLHFNNILQIVFLICGFLLLFLSQGIKNAEVLKEILLIGGWVFIWEMIELELFSDSKNHHNLKVLKKLLKSEIIDDDCQDFHIL